MAVLDSGERSVFDSGAVRDIQKGKGALHLLPLDVLSTMYDNDVYNYFNDYIATKNINYLYHLFRQQSEIIFGNQYNAIREVAIQFEEGAEKYGENNWRKGIPQNAYINSALRHYTKYREGLKDENHDRAFCGMYYV